MAIQLNKTEQEELKKKLAAEKKEKVAEAKKAKAAEKKNQDTLEKLDTEKAIPLKSEAINSSIEEIQQSILSARDSVEGERLETEANRHLNVEAADIRLGHIEAHVRKHDLQWRVLESLKLK